MRRSGAVPEQALGAMSETRSTETLPGSSIRCSETKEELYLHLPRQPIRATTRAALIVTLLSCVAAFVVFLEPPLLFAILTAVFLSLFFTLLIAVFVVPHLVAESVLVTRDRIVVKTATVYGKEGVQENNLSEKAYAKLHHVRSRRHGDFAQGVDVTAKRGTAHFGDALAPGELDWVVWRLNRFLGHTPDADPPRDATRSRAAIPVAIEEIPTIPLAPPAGTKVRLEAGSSETRILFPNSVQMGTYRGAGSAIVGFGWSAFFLFASLQAWTPPRDAAGAMVGAALAVPGLLFLLGGLGHLFGRSRLTISLEHVIYRTTLLGVGPWQKLPTAEIISAGSTKKPRSPSGRITGPAKGYVIRTATREIHYGARLRDAVRSKAEAEWLAGEIALHIQAARSGAKLASVRYRHPDPVHAALESSPTEVPDGPGPLQR